MKKIISFTKLGTLKCNEFELTRDLFFERLKDNMFLNPANNNISYDEETDTYNVVFDGISYVFYYHNDILHSDCKETNIITELKNLINYQKLQEKLNQEKDDFKRRTKHVIANGERGIFKSDKDKVIYIKYLKEEIKKIKDEVKNFPYFDKTDNIYKLSDIIDKYDDAAETYCVIRGVLGLPMAIAGLIIAIFTSMELLGLILLGAGVFLFWITGPTVDDGINISIIAPLVSIIYYSIKRLVEKNRVKRKIKDIVKRMIPLEKSLSDPTLLFKEEVFKVKENKEVSQETYETIKNMIYQLRDRIVLVEDHNKKNKFGNELTQIIDFERMINKNNKSINPQDILNQLKRLSYQVEKEINEKNRVNYNNKACDEIVEECNKVISYHR